MKFPSIISFAFIMLSLSSCGKTMQTKDTRNANNPAPLPQASSNAQGVPGQPTPPPGESPAPGTIGSESANAEKKSDSSPSTGAKSTDGEPKKPDMTTTLNFLETIKTAVASFPGNKLTTLQKEFLTEKLNQVCTDAAAGKKIDLDKVTAEVKIILANRTSTGSLQELLDSFMKQPPATKVNKEQGVTDALEGLVEASIDGDLDRIKASVLDILNAPQK